MKKIESRGFIRAVLSHFIAIILSSTVIVPMYMVLVNSFKPRREGNLMRMTLPTEWLWENYRTVIEQGKLLSSFFNSCLYAFVGAGGVVFIAALGTWVLARRTDRIAKGIYLFIIVGLFLPVNFVVLIKIMSAIGLYGSRIGILLYYLGANAAFSVFVCYGYFGNIPRELDEAAVIDGVGPLRTFVSIIFPLSKPVCVTIFVLTFIGIWSDFTTPLYLINKTSMWPMNLAIYNFFGRYSQQWNLVFADIVVTVLPVFFIYLICQKQIVSGLTSGSVKG
ncbi:MAG: carbohydrate ABC transporter permease [Spirochaetaceae bacterium]|jgi:raffinose/stachyose/melibiose transport system permease protein|nr:carbohydrate ABC transporter permease [Spirochaetaceae bacterium]